MRARSVVALLVVVAGCTFGPSPAHLSSHLRPGGARLSLELGGARIQGSITLAGGKLVGELVAVGGETLLLLVPSGHGSDAVLAEVQLAAIRAMEVQDPPVAEVNGEGRSGSSEWLRPLARYPQGLSPEGIDEFLRSLGQESLVRVSR